jgi:SNF2 family DNA or RNA helicase
MKAMAEKIGNRVWLRTSEPTPGLGQRIKGARWAQQHKCWTLPLRLDACRMLREEFGPSMELGEDLTAWGRLAIAKEARLTALGSTLVGESLQRVPSVSPLMDKALSARPYQSLAARFIAEGRSVLLADEPGLGKTLEVMAGIVESGVPGPYLVVCPVSVIDDAWSSSLTRWLPEHSVHIAAGSHAKRARAVVAANGATDWLIVNHAMIRTITVWECPECGETWKASDKPKSAIIDCGHDHNRVKTIHQHAFPELFAHEWGAIIMDESQDALIRLSGTPTQTRNGARLLEVREDGLRIAASGTPMRGKAHQLWGTLNWLRPKEYTGFWSWCETYFSVQSAGPFGGMIIGDFKANHEPMLWKSLDGVMLRRTKAEVSPELPPKQYMGSPLIPGDEESPIAVWLPMEGEQARAYREMLREGSAEITGGRLDAVGALAEITRLKQFATCYGSIGEEGNFIPSMPSNKAAWLEQFLRELGIVDGDGSGTAKVVVVSRFTAILRAVAESLMDKGVEVCGITGKVKGAARQDVVNRFNAPGGPRVMFLNTKAGGVGITLDSADDMVFLDETDRPDDQTQAEGRINNRRPEEKVAQRRYWYLKSRGSVDEGIAAVNYALDLGQMAMLDGRRGVNFAKAVVEYLEGN